MRTLDRQNAASLTNEEFWAWRAHPISEFILTVFLPDMVKSLETSILRGWRNGTTTPEALSRARGYVEGLEELIAMTRGSIVGFYEGQDGGEEEV